MDLFTLSGGNTATFTLPASPTVSPIFDNNAFSIYDVAVDFNGTPQTLEVDFFDDFYYGGFSIDTNRDLSIEILGLLGPQLFTGSVASPTFLLGTFSIPDPNGGNAYSLTISSAATPEPSTLILLGTGLFGMCGVVRRKMVRA